MKEDGGKLKKINDLISAYMLDSQLFNSVFFQF